MPQLTFKGIKSQCVIDMSKALIDELETIINVPRAYFALEHVDSMYIADGKEAGQYPLVYVNLFDRRRNNIVTGKPLVRLGNGE